MELDVVFRGLTLEVAFDYHQGEECVGLFDRIEIWAVLHEGCDVWDVILACDFEVILAEAVQYELDKI